MTFKEVFKACRSALRSSKNGRKINMDKPTFKAFINASAEDCFSEAWKLASSIHKNEDSEEMMFDSVGSGNPVYMSIWERDCDCMEVTYAKKFSGRVAFKHWFETVLMPGIEGPYNIAWLTEDEYNSFKVSRRDRAAEQMGY